MFELGFSLSGPSGKSIWTTPDPLAADPTVREEMSSFFSRRRTGNGSRDQPDESIARVSAPCFVQMEQFSRRVTLENNMTIYGHQGLMVRIPIKDEKIENGALYALEPNPVLAAQTDLQIKPTLIRAEQDGEITMATDIQNPCPQKYRMHERDIGHLVRVDELSDQQTDEYFQQFQQPYSREELNARKASKLQARPMLSGGPRFFKADA